MSARKQSQGQGPKKLAGARDMPKIPLAGFALVFGVVNGALWMVLGYALLSGIFAGLEAAGPLSVLGASVAAGAVAFFSCFFGLPGDRIVQLELLATPVSVFWLIGMQNTMNFLDGADGLAAGVAFIVAVTLMLAAAGLRQLHVVQLSGALAGACLGFLLFNWYPAKIFMGDSGAHFLGTALGVISILGVAKVAVAFALAVPMLALAVPIADTAWAILRRRRQKASVARADLLHLHHRLQAFGLDQRQTCFVFYTATALLGALGLTLFGHGRILAVVTATCVVLTSTVAADLLMHAGWRIPAPFMRRLLGQSGSR